MGWLGIVILLVTLALVTFLAYDGWFWESFGVGLFFTFLVFSALFVFGMIAIYPISSHFSEPSHTKITEVESIFTDKEVIYPNKSIVITESSNVNYVDTEGHTDKTGGEHVVWSVSDKIEKPVVKVSYRKYKGIAKALYGKKVSSTSYQFYLPK